MYNLKKKILITLVLFLCVVLVQKKNRENFNSSIEKKKLAFCFMIYDKIANQEIWEKFFQKINSNNYTILIHYKENKDLGIFNKYKLDKCIDTCWGCFSLVKAQMLLMKKALEDKNVTHCIWLSGNCLPMKHFNYIYQNLDPKFSYFNKSPDEQVFPRCDTLVKNHSLNRNIIKKAAMQSIINRKHCELILQNTDFIEKFSGIIAADEIAFISAIYNLKKEKELVLTPNISFDATTYTCWPNMINHKDFDNSKKTGKPYKFSYICPEELKMVNKSKSFFGRKFDDNCGGLEPLLKIVS